MNAWQNPSAANCATPIVFPASNPWPGCTVCSAIPWSEPCRCGGAEKNGLRSMRRALPQLLRSPTMGGAGSAVRSVAHFPGAGDPTSGLPQMWREARTAGVAGRDPVLHETICLLRRPTMPGLDDQSGAEELQLDWKTVKELDKQ